MTPNPNKLFTGVHEDDVKVFELLYSEYYPFLCMVAEQILKNPEDSEEVVADVFVKIWNMREDLYFFTSMKAYLCKAVRNTALNYLEKNKHRKEKTLSISAMSTDVITWEKEFPMGELYEKEIRQIVNKCVSSLPDGCREVFILSRDKSLKYSEIADNLSVSVNTVKSQMKKALVILRETLMTYLDLDKTEMDKFYKKTEKNQ